MINVEDAIKVLKATLIAEIYSEFHHSVQSLGGPGLHAENMINRQEALDALRQTKQKIVDKL